MIQWMFPSEGDAALLCDVGDEKQDGRRNRIGQRNPITVIQVQSIRRQLSLVSLNGRDVEYLSPTSHRISFTFTSSNNNFAQDWIDSS